MVLSLSISEKNLGACIATGGATSFPESMSSNTHIVSSLNSEEGDDYSFSPEKRKDFHKS